MLRFITAKSYESDDGDSVAPTVLGSQLEVETGIVDESLPDALLSYTDNRLIRSRKCNYQSRVCKNAISSPL